MELATAKMLAANAAVSKPVLSSAPQSAGKKCVDEIAAADVSPPKLENKEQLVNAVREWVRIDNEIATLQKELLLRKKEKKRVSTTLMDVMRSSSIDCFDLKDGQLMYKQTNVKKPLTKRCLMAILSTYFQGNADRANELNEFIMENREQTMRETIVRKTARK